METKSSDTASKVNNAFYDTLGERWVKAYDDPVALLRAEGELKNPWVIQKIKEYFSTDVRASVSTKHSSGNSSTQSATHSATISAHLESIKILDIGCGAGFLANALSGQKFKVVGMDFAFGALRVAKHCDTTQRTYFTAADAYHLPFPDAFFDVVTSMDFLEHVEDPAQVIAEAARVLKPKGLFFFHTFNRNLLAYLVVVKGVEWFVKNTPKKMHVLPLFIKPKELVAYGQKVGLEKVMIQGIMPDISKWAFWKLLVTRIVPKDFCFRFTPSLAISYLGYAQKNQIKK